MPERRCWIGVASRAHVAKGVAGGFCQLGHGKMAPLKRLAPGDLIAYYAPREDIEGGAPVQAFVAIGEIKEGEPYLARMSASFEAYRRDVDWWPGQEAPVKRLVGRLSFIKDQARWGYPFRRGSFLVSGADFRLIAQAMGVVDRLPPPIRGPGGR
jgi:EVE domain